MNIVGSSPFYTVLCFMTEKFIFMLESIVLCPIRILPHHGI
jgi:hypothetical protein